MLRRVFDIFRVRKEERWPALAWLLMIVATNALVVARYWAQFSQVVDNYHSLVIKQFHLSGFDPLTYALVTDWSPAYNIYRHPLLAFFMYVPYAINHGLIALTGTNCATIVVAAFVVFSAFYALLLLFRVFREVLELNYFDSCALVFLTYSFGYVMVASCAPDHFVTNVRKFFRPANLIFAIILPAALLWLVARVEWRHYEYPRFHARQVAKVKKAKAEKEAVYRMVRDTIQDTSSFAIDQAVKREMQERAWEKFQRRQKLPSVAHAGKPMGKGEFSQWTDMTTDRWASLVENADHLLGDTLIGRPVFVKYSYWANYAVEAVVAALFLLGVWFGRRARFLWLCLSFFLFDMLIHFVLGFGLNEIYIMSPHFLFVIPVAIAYLLLQAKGGRWHRPLSWLCALLAAGLTIYNGSLLVQYLVTP